MKIKEIIFCEHNSVLNMTQSSSKKYFYYFYLKNKKHTYVSESGSDRVCHISELISEKILY